MTNDTMVTILQKSIDMHLDLLIEALREAQHEDAKYLASLSGSSGGNTERNKRAGQAIIARMAGIENGISALTGTAGGDAEAVSLMGLGPLILAFTEACRLQGIQSYQRNVIAANS